MHLDDFTVILVALLVPALDVNKERQRRDRSPTIEPAAKTVEDNPSLHPCTRRHRCGTWSPRSRDGVATFLLLYIVSTSWVLDVTHILSTAPYSASTRRHWSSGGECYLRIIHTSPLA